MGLYSLDLSKELELEIIDKEIGDVENFVQNAQKLGIVVE